MADRDLGVMDIDHVDQIANIDTINLTYLLDAFMTQISRCQSANVYATDEHDLDIWDKMFEHFAKTFDTMHSRPKLFLPKYSPKLLAVEKTSVNKKVVFYCVTYKLFIVL